MTASRRLLPSFTVRCVSFLGNSQTGTQFRDKSDASSDGNLLPYTGVGTGIMRALELESGMVMVNDVELQEFVVTFRRVETGEDNGEVDAKNGEDKPLNVNEDGLGNGVWFAHYASHSRFAHHFELGCS